MKVSAFTHIIVCKFLHNHARIYPEIVKRVRCLENDYGLHIVYCFTAQGQFVNAPLQFCR
jgi:hypothetical protein